MMSQSFLSYPAFKRILDVFGSAILLIITSPILLITAIIVRLKLGKPVIFSQPRPGLNEHIFYLFKFRSMKNIDVENGLISDEQRMTAFGRLLRSTSLDELPSLWNVFRGQMSFVGPRPLLVDYLPLYSEKERTRHSTRPGITGLAQSSGRNSLTWNEKFELDIYYIENMSFALDFKILISTAATVIQRQGVSAPSHETMPPFTGKD